MYLIPYFVFYIMYTLLHMKNYIWCIWLHLYKQQIKLNQVWNLNCTHIYIYICDLYIYTYIYSPLCPRCRRSRSCASFASLKPWVRRAFCGTWAWSLYWQEPLVKKTTLHRLATNKGLSGLGVISRNVSGWSIGKWMEMRDVEVRIGFSKMK